LINEPVIEFLRDLKQSQALSALANQIVTRVIATVRDCAKPISPGIKQSVDLIALMTPNKELQFKIKCKEKFYSDNLKAIAENNGFQFSLGRQGFEPRTDASIKDGKMVILLEIPGRLKNLDVYIDGNFVVAKGEKLLSTFEVSNDQNKMADKFVEYSTADPFIQSIDHGPFEKQIPLQEGFEKATNQNLSDFRKNGMWQIVVTKPTVVMNIRNGRDDD